jgi:imidazoleglycerol phosphate dehydratase HisB
MKIWIDNTALRSSSDSLLPSGALFAMKYLQENDVVLSFDVSTLSNQQTELIKNEEIHLGDFEAKEADGLIQRKQSFQFITNEALIEEAPDWASLSHSILFPNRKAVIQRNTKETDISVSINLDGTGESEIKTGLNFFDHMLEQIARHGLVDLEIRCDGDLEVDEHHSIEDTAIALGQAIREAISDNKAGIQRYGFALPMDEAQANVAIDLSDRPYLEWDVKLKREYVGDFPTEMLEHFFYSLAMNARATLHVSADGKNEHHIIEAIFKGFAKALRFSVSRNERIKGILPTTKGTI